MFYGLTNRRAEPQSVGGLPNGFRRLTSVFNEALNAIKAARPSVAAERREQEFTQGIYPQSPPPVHHDPFVARTLDPNNGALGGRGSGHQGNAPVQATRPGTSGRVGGPATSPPRQPLKDPTRHQHTASRAHSTAVSVATPSVSAVQNCLQDRAVPTISAVGGNNARHEIPLSGAVR